MASFTLLNAVTSDTTGTGTEITGDFDLLVRGFHAGGQVELQASLDDVTGNYRPVATDGRFNGDGWVNIRNVGTKYFRGVLRGAKAGEANSTMIATQ